MDNYEDRPMRPCVGCGKVDRAPRDVVALPDGNSAYYHMDCHVLIADCAVCKSVLKGAGGLKNEKLVGFLTDQMDPETKTDAIFTTANASGDPRVELAGGVK